MKTMEFEVQLLLERGAAASRATIRGGATVGERCGRLCTMVYPQGRQTVGSVFLQLHSWSSPTPEL